MIAGLAVLDPKIKAASRQLSELVEANGSGLMNLKGIGPSGAPPAR